MQPPPTGEIYQRLNACMQDIEAIGKGRRNSAQGYNFRGIDDVYNELHNVLAKHGVFTVPYVMEERTEDRTTGKGNALIYRVLKIHFTFFAVDGSSVTACVIGEGMDSGDKASNKAMAVAHKYALMQVFCIPTEDAKDPEVARPDEVEKDPVLPTPQVQAFTQSNAAACARVQQILTEAGIIDPETLSGILSKLEGAPLSQVRSRLNVLTQGKVAVDVSK